MNQLSPNAIVLLNQMSKFGRPSQPSDMSWSELHAKGLVERDFIGPKGIKAELAKAVRDRLRELATRQMNLPTTSF